MEIENIIKVMNFHSLLRVDFARKNAEKYFEYEKELNNFADNILNNRNLILDKKMLKIDSSKKPLHIYIANDLGFCGSFNTNVNEIAKKEEDADKIIIGKKILKNKKNVLLQMSKDEYKENVKKIEDLLFDSIKNSKHGEIKLIYNHYHNISNIELVEKTLLPLKQKEEKDRQKYKEDFAIEGDINEILINIIVLYLSYEIRIAEENSYASENVMRQMITKESLKKIKEIKEEKKLEERKEKKAKNFKKTIENVIKMKNNKTDSYNS